jgi:ParB family transcriptional regulator, chromosome partitioning protein
MSRKHGLGKGLSALLSATMKESIVSEPEHLFMVAIDTIQPSPLQPRVIFTEEALKELAASIASQGILQPLVVRVVGEHYEIIAGERRFRAAKLLGLKNVPVFVKQVSDEAVLSMALIENIQREDLNPMEEARALKRLAESTGQTHEQLATLVGKSRAAVSNSLRLLLLAPSLQGWLEEGGIEMGHARALLSLEPAQQKALGQKIKDQRLSVREAERMVVLYQKQRKSDSLGASAGTTDPHIRDLEQRLSERLGTRVEFRVTKVGKGRIQIHYNTLDELDGILEHIH